MKWNKEEMLKVQRTYNRALKDIEKRRLKAMSKRLTEAIEELNNLVDELNMIILCK